jgi:hypothetical protein
MPRGFLGAVLVSVRPEDPDVAILYPDIEYVDEILGYGVLWRVS